MSTTTISLTDELRQYILDATSQEPDLFRKLRDETAHVLPDRKEMQIAPEQGQFMHLLVKLLGARRCIEVGTFTGYSSLWIASALPADGKLICCDKSEEFTAIARKYWQAAGFADRVELRLGAGVESLDKLLADGGAGRFDFAFIDADKEGYNDYYDRCMKLIRVGGLIAFDNALSDGRVVAPKDHPNTSAPLIDALNRRIGADDRVTVSLLPIGDGLLLAQKR